MKQLLKKLGNLYDKKDFTDDDNVEAINTVSEVLNLFGQKEVLPPEAIGVIAEDLSKKYTVPELKKLLKENNLKVSGKEEVLIQRLLDAGVDL